QGLQNVLELYQLAADDWNKNPNSIQNKERVLNEFRGANRHFESAMPSFQLAVNVYAEAANLHLLLLRDAVKFGKEWGMSSLPGEEWDDMYTRLQSRTATYTDYCVNTYNNGLQQAKSLQANVSDYNRYPWTQYNQSGGTPVRFRDAKGEYRGTENWNLYNAYRRDMTIMVLDIITLFPTYDPGLYSTPVKSELTREVYTDIRGTTWWSDAALNTIDGIENRMLGNRQSQLFTWLTGMNLYIRYTGKSTNFTHGDLMVGLEKKVRKTNASDQWLPVEGQKTNYTRVDRPGIEFGEYYWNYARTQQWFETRLLQLWVNFGTLSLNAGTIGVGGEFWQRDLPQYKDIYARSTRDHSIENHRLSWIKFEPVRDGCPFAWPEYKQLSALLFGWTHNSVDLFNTIASGRITQIPAVKGNGLENIATGTATVRRGTGSTGGDFVQLIGNTPAGEGRLHISFTSSGSRNYRVRFRYGSTTGGRLRVSTPTGDKYTNIQRTYGGGLPTAYNEFQYADLGVQTVYANHWFVIVAETGTNVVIDKIEFIPA
ncbi:insecticidal delta-endotoxin Cry8Ea1 family protein, partial [Bacillus cereus group sp. IBL03679]